MSEISAQTLSQVVADNVRRWRVWRDLDQQGLADRLTELGWKTDRTTVNRLEREKRQVTVEDLGLLAVALNVPISVLLIPMFEERVNVQLAPNGEVAAVNPWLMWNWMRGETPLPGRARNMEWRGGMHALLAYEAVHAANLALQDLGPEPSGPEYAKRLQDLEDAVSAMEGSDMYARDLVAPRHAKDIRRLNIAARTPGRYRSVDALRVATEES